ncbi:MAG: hypothetical protein U5K38_00285 [Woeseiaceae bacterium]|nr:hypothetical protein [Woeseiaceae bacterium]
MSFDLKRGSKKPLIRGKVDVAQIEFDGEGNPWVARGFDLGKGEFIWYYRPPGGSGWTEIHRMDENSFEQFSIVGLDDAKAGNILVIANNGNDKAGLWSFNTSTKQFEELIYRRSDVDVAGIRMHSNDWTDPDKVAGVAYQKDATHFEYFDEIEAATYQQLEGLVPYAHGVVYYQPLAGRPDADGLQLGPTRSRNLLPDKRRRVSENWQQRPLIDGENLADVRYITYKARDGVNIPAFITVPHGEPPFPTVVMPHGGPFVSESSGL